MPTPTSPTALPGTADSDANDDGEELDDAFLDDIPDATAHDGGPLPALDEELAAG